MEFRVQIGFFGGTMQRTRLCWASAGIFLEAGQFFRSLENWMQIKATLDLPQWERGKLSRWTDYMRWKWMGRASERTIGATRSFQSTPLPYSISSDKFAGSRKWRRRQHPITPARKEIYSERKIALSAAAAAPSSASMVQRWVTDGVSASRSQDASVQQRLIAPMSVTFALLATDALKRFHLVSFACKHMRKTSSTANWCTKWCILFFGLERFCLIHN